MKPKIQFNTRLLRRVQKHISEEPNRLVMTCVIKLKDDDDDIKFYGDGDGDDYVKYADCGTAACIAGWTLCLSGIDKRKIADSVNWDIRAKKLLGLTSEQASQLFYATHWVGNYGSRYAAAKTQKQRVRVAIQYIDYFIKHRDNLGD